MLKITYSETGIYLERLSYSLEELVSLRVMLALRLGQNLLIQPGTATLLLPIATRRILLSLIQETAIAITPCDAEFLEVELRGSWMAQDGERQDGIFVAEVGDRAELILLTLWRDALDRLALPQGSCQERFPR
ncbi:MAG: hypothetical protein VKJ24_06420 [Synechococcales bacterium]|nr:hypothetical protein [Synechococcales bacterium]